MSVYVISHKPSMCPKLNGYHLIQVGASNKKHYCSITDDTGDNISWKNPFYCELTGLYWIWKNASDEYVGIVHYRRFFTESFFETNLLKESKIIRILQDYDVILPIKTRLKRTTVSLQFLENTGTEYDLNILQSAILDKFPEYIETYNRVFNGADAYFRNMFISKKNIFDSYCAWLFDILDEVEKRIDISSYDAYHKRIYGFFAERLLYVYVLHNKLRVYEVGVVQTDLKQNPIKRLAKRCQRVFYCLLQ